MKRQFARHGIPNELLTDNGPQFESHEYLSFTQEYGFTIVKSSPYYSRGNGKAEWAVKIAKNILEKSRKENPYLALLAYRNTPQQGYNYSPAQPRMSRRLKDIIPTAHHQLIPQTSSPSLVHEDIAERRRISMAQYTKEVSQHLREFSKGKKVFVKPTPENKHQPWMYGEVIGSTAPRSCTVNTSEGPVRRPPSRFRDFFIIHIWTAVVDESEEWSSLLIFQFKQLERRSLKNQGLNGIRTRDLCVTGTMLYQLSYEATHWERGQFTEFISSREEWNDVKYNEIIHIWTAVVDESEEWSSQLNLTVMIILHFKEKKH